MINISRQQLAVFASYSDLVEVLRRAFQTDTISPERHVHPLKRAGEADGSLLLMPAWSDTSQRIDAEKFAGLKTVFVLPDNARRRAATVQASYLLFSGSDGQTLAIMDGKELTLRRTAAASALASDYLARKDTAKMLMVGAGALSAHLVRAHASVRGIKEVSVFNRTAAKAELLARQLCDEGFNARLCDNLEQDVAGADIVSCATTSTSAVIKGSWLTAGTHVDLVGAFRPDMREIDGDGIGRGDVFVDTRQGAMGEAGDILQAIDEGRFSENDIVADLFELTAGTKAGRIDDKQITLFKSCGAALEDLAAAIHIYQQYRHRDKADPTG
jgi:ornithine cyclodeaminase